MSFSEASRHAWVNTFQTVLFLSFGAIAIIVIGTGMGGFSASHRRNAASPPSLRCSRGELISPRFSSAIASSRSPSLSAHLHLLLTQEDVAIQETVIFYICWNARVFLGVAATTVKKCRRIEEKIQAPQVLAAKGPTLSASERGALREKMASDDDGAATAR